MDEVGGYAAAMTRVLEHRSLRDKLGWVMPELAELGYTGVEVHNVHRYPELIGQSSNIKFVRDKEAKSQREYSAWHGKGRQRS